MAKLLGTSPGVGGMVDGVAAMAIWAIGMGHRQWWAVAQVKILKQIEAERSSCGRWQVAPWMKGGFDKVVGKSDVQKQCG